MVSYFVEEDMTMMLLPYWLLVVRKSEWNLLLCCWLLIIVARLRLFQARTSNNAIDDNTLYCCHSICICQGGENVCIVRLQWNGESNTTNE